MRERPRQRRDRVDRARRDVEPLHGARIDSGLGVAHATEQVDRIPDGGDRGVAHRDRQVPDLGERHAVGGGEHLGHHAGAVVATEHVRRPPEARSDVIGTRSGERADHCRRALARDGLHVRRAVLARAAPAEHQDAVAGTHGRGIVDCHRECAGRSCGTRRGVDGDDRRGGELRGVEAADDGELLPRRNHDLACDGCGQRPRRVHCLDRSDGCGGGSRRAGAGRRRVCAPTAARHRADENKQRDDRNSEVRAAHEFHTRSTRCSRSWPRKLTVPVSSPSADPAEAGNPAHRAPSTRRK